MWSLGRQTQVVIGWGDCLQDSERQAVTSRTEFAVEFRHTRDQKFEGRLKYVITEIRGQLSDVTGGHDQ